MSLFFFPMTAALLQLWRLNNNVRVLLDAFLRKELKARISGLEMVLDDFSSFHAIELLEGLLLDGIMPDL